eukprot:PhF_6_TR13569/c0_g1_i1/m.21698
MPRVPLRAEGERAPACLLPILPIPLSLYQTLRHPHPSKRTPKSPFPPKPPSSPILQLDTKTQSDHGVPSITATTNTNSDTAAAAEPFQLPNRLIVQFDDSSVEEQPSSAGGWMSSPQPSALVVPTCHCTDLLETEGEDDVPPPPRRTSVKGATPTPRNVVTTPHVNRMVWFSPRCVVSEKQRKYWENAKPTFSLHGPVCEPLSFLMEQQKRLYAPATFESLLPKSLDQLLQEYPDFLKDWDKKDLEYRARLRELWQIDGDLRTEVLLKGLDQGLFKRVRRYRIKRAPKGRIVSMSQGLEGNTGSNID